MPQARTALKAAPEQASLTPPAVALPKGGGAIRGVDEKFSANPATGSGSYTVRVPVSRGRSNFAPHLALTYDSGAGNGPFGLGWSLSLPMISRKTDKGLPRYLDAVDSDVFLLSGAEDLAPVYRKKTDGSWARDADGRLVVHEDEVDGYLVRRYRPRVEGAFSRIERWTELGSAGDVHWRSIGKDNVLTVYGSDARSRIADPLDPTHIFSWLICEMRDAKGNAVVYWYEPEDGDGVDLGMAHERNRGPSDDVRRTANRYLKRIHYGNRESLLVNGKRPAHFPTDVDPNWMFEVVLDYGEHDDRAPAPRDAGMWTYRPDPFASYRSGFEVRTTRLCRRILMFHHFPGAAGVGNDCLVRSTDFTYSDELDPVAVSEPVYTFLRSATVTGHRRRTGGYDARSLPPVEFEYSQPVIRDEPEEVDPESLENLPIGLDGGAYRWTDLHGEGVSGILTEQAGGWFYKRNLSPLPVRRPDGEERVSARFEALEPVAMRPNAGLGAGAEIMDLAGDGQPDVVVLEGETPGMFEHDEAEGWQPFLPFKSRLTRDLRDPNLRLVDLDGDGHADVLITEDDALLWHPSLAEDGFGPARRVAHALDEEECPRVVFGDGTQSIHLADLSGDGSADIVRVRNGDVCYWPNLGHGCFGVKVTMDNAPWFDHPDQFEPGRIRLADIDGTGTTDLIYLHSDGVRLYFNQSGNAWSRRRQLTALPSTDEPGGIVAIDFLGNGTACLVWSSSLPGDARRPMRYLSLMGERKPHMLIGSANNLGAETRVEYAPSTKFYLRDKQAGHPWLTRLPFPVQVVERVETYDHVSRNSFVSLYAYHHGYFDGEEREFRGFGMVEQWDTEQLPAAVDPNLSRSDAATPHVPPVHTKSWFHTGVDLRFEGEYWPETGVNPAEAAELLLPDTVLPAGLSPQEQREATRALKGAMLRQEVYADDAGSGAAAGDIERAGTPYTVTEQNFSIQVLQPRDRNRHAVFFTHPREAISFHYERNAADPRVQHTLTLEVDAYGNVLKHSNVGYGRRTTLRAIDEQGRVRRVQNAGLAGLTVEDRVQQTTTLVTYTESQVSDAIDLPDAHCAPLPTETTGFELTGYTPTGPAGRFRAGDLVEPDPATPGRLRHRFTNEVHYEAAGAGACCRRRIECVRTLYRRNDLTGLLPLGEAESLALSGEGYRLAFTESLLAEVYARPRAGQADEDLLPDPATVLGGAAGDQGGYVSNQRLAADGLFPAANGEELWWIPSGRAFFSSDATDDAAAELTKAREHFFLPRRYRDTFGHDSFVDFDTNDLLVAETRDALGNRVTAHVNDYRVLQPRLVTDPNGNRREVAFDSLGLVVGTAVMGKPPPAPAQGDTLAGFVPDLAQAQLDAFLEGADPRAAAATLLGDASTRIVYDVDRFRRTRQAHPNDAAQWQPPCAATIARETHVSDPLPPHGLRLQINFSYSDGFGRQVQRKEQAEPGPVVEGHPPLSPRWAGSGWTIYNNKGKPVRQFEPFFSATHQFEFGLTAGVGPVLFYDPAGRVVATLHPNHTYEKVVFDAWQQTSHDVNDTCAPRDDERGDPRTDPDIRGYMAPYFSSMPVTIPPSPWRTWREQRTGGDRGPHEQAAATRAAAHAATPTTLRLDVLGRPFMTVARNRVVCTGHELDGTEESYVSRLELDIEGNQRTVRDADTQAADPLGRIVMRFRHDMLGNRIHEHSMDAGARWTLNDAAGKPIRAWDSRGHSFVTVHDELRRPVGQTVHGTAGSDPRAAGRELLFDKIEYGEPPLNATAAAAERARRLNLRGRIYRHFDSAGLATNARLDAAGDPLEAYDFKGNALRTTRRLLALYKEIPDWAQDPEAQLEDERFEASTRYDALDRPIQSVSPHSNITRGNPPRLRLNVIQPVFNAASLPERLDVWLERASEPTGLLDPAAQTPSPVGLANVDYDAKGQRTRVDMRTEDGTVIRTAYRYDPETFRLTHVYTRRGVDASTSAGIAFTEDCENPNPPPDTIAAPEAPSQGNHCGLQNLHYAYEPIGNIAHIQDDAQQTIFFKNQRVEPSNDFTYDAAYRLIQASGREHLGQTPSGALNTPTAPSAFDTFHTQRDHPNAESTMGTYIERYVYDAAGNILGLRHRGSDPAHAGWTRSYDYLETSLTENGSSGAPSKTGNRLTRTTLAPSGANPQVQPYAHDPHGNMVRMPHLASVAPGPNMAWDYDDRLQRVDRGGAGAAYYAYDASGARVRKVWEKAPGLTEERIYLGGFEIFRRHAGAVGADTALLERETLHVMDGQERVALVETRTLDTAGNDQAPRRLIRYQLTNHLGSACLELDTQAQILSYEEYSPYGSSTYQAVRSQTETPKRYRYTGNERDEESGLDYHGARYYAPWIARWTSCDPLGVNATLNGLAYGRNNPVSNVDPSGEADYGWPKGAVFVSPPNTRSAGSMAHAEILPQVQERINASGFFEADIEFETLPGGSNRPGSKSPGRGDLRVWGSTQGNQIYDAKPEGSKANVKAQTGRYARFDKTAFSSKSGVRPLTDFVANALEPVEAPGRTYLLSQSGSKPEQLGYHMYDADQVKTPEVTVKPKLSSTAAASPDPIVASPGAQQQTVSGSMKPAEPPIETTAKKLGATEPVPPAAKPVEARTGLLSSIKSSPVTGMAVGMVVKAATQWVSEKIVDNLVASSVNSLVSDVGGEPMTADQVGQSASGQRAVVSGLLGAAPPGADIGIALTAGSIAHFVSDMVFKPVMTEYSKQYPTPVDFYNEVYAGF